ncbi:hypothetical protein ABI_15270 [Asticcacaulis biprosthecium C19]|uniref:Uncharacterized protein n=1 Tax=Asticcacaulis biprosthecium C19 TaxID=715226 RepID=F4QJ24_9CAUL|nr:hypothetical protein [Asticcacaulis biprosthecium]EGF93087.1 hypothetical protein ABI_15270 [Asticcacaulis biprosthecium C19]
MQAITAEQGHIRAHPIFVVKEKRPAAFIALRCIKTMPEHGLVFGDIYGGAPSTRGGGQHRHAGNATFLVRVGQGKPQDISANLFEPVNPERRYLWPGLN